MAIVSFRSHERRSWQTMIGSFRRPMWSLACFPAKMLPRPSRRPQLPPAPADGNTVPVRHVRHRRNRRARWHPHPMCFGFSQRCGQLAEAVGASDSGCYSRWASRRSFLFDDAAAKAMEQALSRHAPAEAIPSGKPLALPTAGEWSAGDDKEMVETLSLRRRRRPPPRALSLLRRDIRYPRLLPGAGALQPPSRRRRAACH